MTFESISEKQIWAILQNDQSIVSRVPKLSMYLRPLLTSPVMEHQMGKTIPHIEILTLTMQRLDGKMESGGGGARSVYHSMYLEYKNGGNLSRESYPCATSNLVSMSYTHLP